MNVFNNLCVSIRRVDIAIIAASSLPNNIFDPALSLRLPCRTLLDRLHQARNVIWLLKRMDEQMHVVGHKCVGKHSVLVATNGVGDTSCKETADSLVGKIRLFVLGREGQKMRISRIVVDLFGLKLLERHSELLPFEVR